MANEQNLKPFKKGEVANPNGRPKKYVTLLKESGYKLSEINDTKFLNSSVSGTPFGFLIIS